ncbi:MAG TPA: hypothetical protein VIL65_06380 [Beijerinckiaceae bacterium]|jgi:hypothetical protein
MDARPALIAPTEPATAAFRRYVLRALSLALAALAAVTGFMLAYDAFGLFGTRVMALDRFPAAQRLQMNGDRVLKALHLARARPNVLLVGTSRTGDGFDPDGPALRTARAYNAGLAGSATPEHLAVLRFAQGRAPLTRVVLVLDFETFVHPTGIPGDFARSAFAGADLGSGIFQHLWSTQAIGETFGLARQLARGERLSHPFYVNGRYPLFRVSPAETRTAFLRESRLALSLYAAASLVADGPAQDARFAALGEALRALRTAGIAVDVAASPVHAWRLELQERLGFAGAYDDWKRRLARLAADLNGAPGTGQVRFFDFGVAAPETTESLPARAADPPTRFFVEASHFDPALGEIVLARMGGEEAAQGFGARLAPDTVEPHLAGSRAAYEAWRQARAEEVALIARLVEEDPRTPAIRALAGRAVRPPSASPASGRD